MIAVFVAVAVLPSIFFFAAGFSEDDTATASATGTVLWLTGIALLTGAVGAVLTWAIARRPSSAARSTGLGFLLALAGLWGLVTGFLGGAVISMERHPTWDDA